MPSTLLFCIALLLASFPNVHPLPQIREDDCSTGLLGLAPCLPFINGAVVVPPDTCCDNLRSMLHDHPSCVCQALNQSSTLPVNMSLVLELPSLCHLDLGGTAGACAGIPLAPSASPPANSPHKGMNSTAPSMLMPVATPSPRTSGQLLRKSQGFKLRADGIPVALGLMALVLTLAA